MSLRIGAPDSLLAGWASWRPLVSSWDGGRLLAADIPVIGGYVSADVSRAVALSGRVLVARHSVVRVADLPPTGRTAQLLRPGASRYRMGWLPGPDDARHPLASDGQVLRIGIAVGSPMREGVEYVTQVATLRVVEAVEADDGSVDVTVEGCMQIPVDAGITTPTAPRAGGTLASEFRRLLPAGMTAAIDPTLTDRAVPRSLEWADDRMAALASIASAWPARMRETDDGQVALLAPLPEAVTPEVTLTDGVRGTVVSAPSTTSRLGVRNEWMARGTDQGVDRPPVQAVARQTTGRYSVAAYGTVTGYFASPLLATQAQCEAAAWTRLRTELLPARTVTVTHAPDPRIMLDTAVLVRKGDRVWRGYVTGYRIPLTVDDGDQITTVGVIE